MHFILLDGFRFIYIYIYMCVCVCVYHLIAWLNVNFFYNSQRIPFPTQSCLVLHSLCTNFSTFCEFLFHISCKCIFCSMYKFLFCNANTNTRVYGAKNWFAITRIYEKLCWSNSSGLSLIFILCALRICLCNLCCLSWLEHWKMKTLALNGRFYFIRRKNERNYFGRQQL